MKKERKNRERFYGRLTLQPVETHTLAPLETETAYRVIVWNNPINFIDPFGLHHEPITLEDFYKLPPEAIERIKIIIDITVPIVCLFYPCDIPTIPKDIDKWLPPFPPLPPPSPADAAEPPGGGPSGTGGAGTGGAGTGAGGGGTGGGGAGTGGAGTGGAGTGGIGPRTGPSGWGC